MPNWQGSSVQLPSATRNLRGSDYESLAQQLRSYLQEKQSPLAPYASSFVQSGTEHGVDPRLLVAISGAESSFGQQNFRPNNPFGWGGMSFGSYPEAIDTVAKGLSENYLGQGLTTIPEIGSKYSPPNINPNWLPNVSSFYSQLGGQQPAVASAGTAPAAPASFPPSGFPSLGNPSMLSSLSSLTPYLPSNMGTPFMDAIIGGRGMPSPREIIGSSQLASPDLSSQLPSLTPFLPPMNQTLPMPSGYAPSASTLPYKGGGADAETLPFRGQTPEASNLVHVSANADRSGVTTQPQVVDFVGKVAQLAGKPLTITTGSNHNRYVAGTNRESDHWQGRAADVLYGKGTESRPDPALTRARPRYVAPPLKHTMPKAWE